MRKTMILENNNILDGSNFADFTRSFLGLTVFTATLIASTTAFSQTVIMLDDELLGTIDPMFREQVKKEALDERIAPKKVVGSEKFKADVPQPNREYKKKRKIIKTAKSEAEEVKAAESSMQAVFSQPVAAPIQENTSLSRSSVYGAQAIDIKGTDEPLGQNSNLGPRGLQTRSQLNQASQISGRNSGTGFGNGRVRRVQQATAVLDGVTTGGIPTSKANNSVGQVEAGTRRVARQNPYEAQGFRLGSWLAFANLRQSAAYSTNLESTANAKSGFISQSNAEYSARSNWARHQAQINASGGFTRNFGASDTQIPTGNVSGELRLDLADDATGTSKLSYGYTTEAVNSTTLTGNVSKRPGVHTIKGSSSLEKSGTRLSFSLRTSVDRTIYDDANLTSGGLLSQEDRNNNHYQLTARSTYEVSAAFSPFAEATIGRRDFDLSKDRNNQERNASTYAFAVGTGIDLGEKITGDISVGYSVEEFEDKNLKNLEGFTFNGSLIWSPIRETTVALNAFTSFSGATAAGVSGSIVNNGDLTITRQISDRTQVSATTGVTVTTDTDYKVDTTLWNVGTNFEYSLNNHLALTGALEYQQQFSDTASRAYDSTTLRTGIKLQR